MIEIGLKVGDSFIIREVEFRVDYVNKEKNRLTASNIHNTVVAFQVGEKFLIGSTTYKITYLKDKAKVISITPLYSGY